MGKCTIKAVLLIAASIAADRRAAAFSPPNGPIGTISSVPQTTFGFNSPRMGMTGDQGVLVKHVAVLYANPSGDEDISTESSSPDDPGHDGKKTKSVARFGGRRSGVRRSTPESAKDLPGFVKLGASAALAVALFRALLGVLFGGAGSAPPSYVYYQASMYESRTLGPDGKMETTRKESVRSNVPSLISGDRKDSAGRSSPASSFLLREAPDDTVDREINDAIRRSMEIEKSFSRLMIDDFF